MFVCKPCHDADPTCPAGAKEMEELGRTFMESWGRCESCGETRGCIDCHGYGSIEDPAKMAKLDALNDPAHQTLAAPPAPGRHRAGVPIPTPREEGTEMTTTTEERHVHEFDETTLTCECGVTLAEHVRGIA